jgi:2-polyprenyl-6-methoxyphenol hydroxylase-like FAD-dependent oxidoreductase
VNRPAGKALIIGGGIAGPVAALSLQRAGIESEIAEARDTFDEYASSWLIMAGNGLNVLKTLGLDSAVAAEGSPIPRMVLSSGSGKRFGEVSNGARPGIAAPSMVVKRGALSRILREEAMRRGVKVTSGKKLQGIEVADGQSAVATFANRDSAEGSFLIGADGIHSRVRQFINPSAPEPTYTGMMSVGGFSGARLPPTPDTLHLVFGRRAFTGYHINPSGEASWFVTFPQAEPPDRAAVNQIGSDEWRRRALDLLREDLPVIQEIVGTTERITGYPIYDIPTQPIWSKGPAVLAGDAIHAVSPTAGQGASLAMEDALVLAQCLRDIPVLGQAFATYDRLRRGRVERVVKYARNLGTWQAMTNPVQIWMWESLMPFFLKRSDNPAALDWLYSYTVDWETSIQPTP